MPIWIGMRHLIAVMLMSGVASAATLEEVERGMLESTAAEPYLTKCARQRAGVMEHASGSVGALNLCFAALSVDIKTKTEKAAAQKRDHDIIARAKAFTDAKAKEQADKQARIDDMLKYPMAQRILFSTQLCAAQAYRKDKMAEIAKEHHYAKIGGAINLQTLSDLQAYVRRADELISEARANGKGLALFQCTDKRVAPMIDCWNGTQETCSQDMTDLLSLVFTVADIEGTVISGN